MLETIITILHVVVALFMILVVLLQTGKGDGMGAAFGGGGSPGAFGASGGMSFFGKLTATAATLFMLTSMSLAYISSTSSSVVDDVIDEAGQVDTQPELGEEKPADAVEDKATDLADDKAEPKKADGASGAANKIIIKDKSGNPLKNIVIEEVTPDSAKKKAEAKKAE